MALDLRDLLLVDREAVKLLAFHESNGAELKNCRAYIREWVTKEGQFSIRKDNHRSLVTQWPSLCHVFGVNEPRARPRYRRWQGSEGYGKSHEDCRQGYGPRHRKSS
jgi:hypothetical protein